ncbi:S-layer homology domain-containing protein [Paenibacillus pasadenensis]|uniref:S-layer homology domain-containing protein n=1 Tax=Paenibacillus pasadenensis TaxID=217090 RepID=UPI00203DC758|nr:S-layer homology domain-containing protein [Paenibacillus pasadenensis]
MFKRLSAMFLMLALVAQLLPVFPARTADAAATGYFTFPKESSSSMQPRTTTSGRVNLEGSVSNIDPTSISYSVLQIVNNKGNDDPGDDQIGAKTEDVKGGIYLSGYNLTVNNIQLYSGLNRITFKGLQGGAEVSTSIYILYHDGPVFYNLAARLDGSTFPMKENATTVVSSGASRGRTTADIAITGNAPNAEKVTIEVNGASRSYNVSATNNYEFTISPLTLKKGKNLATIKVTNNNQTVETTREIAFYNGEVTFYDLNLNELSGTPSAVSKSAALEYSPDFATGQAGAPGNLSITGTVIVPNNKKVVNGETVPNPNPTQPINITPRLDGVAGTPFQAIPTVTGSAYNPEDAYYIYNVNIKLDQLKTGAYLYDKAYFLTLEALNTVDNESQGVYNLKFTFRDSNQPYISEINYLPGYKNTGDLNIPSKPLSGMNIYDTPLAMEVLIGNTTDTTLTLEVDKVTDINGNVAGAQTPTVVSSTTVTRTVNGINQTFVRKIVVFDKLPFEGTQTVTFKHSTNQFGSVTFNMLFGPFLKYKSIYDTMKIDYDSTKATQLDTIVANTLSNFEATLTNLNDLTDIRYTPTANKPQTMFFYINNTPIGIEEGTAVNTFRASASGISAAKEIMKAAGAFNLKFVYKGSKNNYENSVTVFLNQVNLPVIPVEADSIYPYSSDLPAPLPNDPNFPKQGSVFTTKEPYMNVHGTFDFVDLGTNLNEVANSLASNTITKTNFILKIEGSNLSKPVIWNLSKELRIIDSSLPKEQQSIGVVNTGLTIPEIDKQGERVPKLTVTYDVKTQSFSWVLSNQYLSKDGTSSVFNFFVYNNGEAGARASYRLEVDPTALPYKILRPLNSKRTVNQNFVEVVIDAPSAKTVTVNKQNGQKITFDADNDGTIDYTTAYRVVISGLKAGKNDLKFTIANENDSINGTITVTYAPTNIPGAGFMEEMKSSHKLFESQLQLTFPKSTTLIRRDYNVPEKLKNQVFTGHRLLFGIANPTDGVVDRHEFETPPANFDLILDSLGNMFENTFSSNFNKASNVFWIDAGMADNPQTDSVNDPLQYGIDPYQYPTAELPSYVDRPVNRELVTSKEGKLTLSYNPNIVDANGTFITVFHFDPKKPEWVNLGGVVDTKKNTVTVPFREFGYYVVGQLKYSYLDITTHPYARNYLEAMYSKGFMNAAGIDEFGANLYTSRGEFATMMVKALGIPLNYNTDPSKRLFNDVGVESTALWDYRYIETAFNEGYIRGTAPKTFEPTSNLTREDAAVILARALKLKLETDPVKIEKALQKSFKDYSQINYYARASVLAIYQKGYIQGSPVDSQNPKNGFVFEPKANLLRSDSGIILGRVLVGMKRLPKIN